jgi:hypothetical protein
MKRRTETPLDPSIADDDKQQFGLPSIGIPAEVLFNPELSHLQKMLFGYLRNLSQTEKGCWASNRYLSRCLGVEKQTISNAVSKLKEYLYIKVQFRTLANGMQGRVIYLNDFYPHIYAKYIQQVYKNLNKGIVIGLYPPVKNFIDPYKKVNPKYVIEEESNEESNKIVPIAAHLNGYVVPSDFTKFWEMYPSKRKGLKGKALTAFEKICRPSFPHRPTWQRLRAAILKQQQSEQWKADGGKYIPLAASWLNGKRWMDDPKELKRHRFNGEEQNNYQENHLSGKKGWIGNKFAEQ